MLIIDTDNISKSQFSHLGPYLDCQTNIYYVTDEWLLNGNEDFNLEGYKYDFTLHIWTKKENK